MDEMQELLKIIRCITSPRSKTAQSLCHPIRIRPVKTIISAISQIRLAVLVTGLLFLRNNLTLAYVVKQELKNRKQTFSQKSSPLYQPLVLSLTRLGRFFF